MTFDSFTGQSSQVNPEIDSFLGGNGAVRGKRGVTRISLVEDGIESTFDFRDAGKVPGLFNEVGDSGSYEAVLLNEAGEQIGTSSIEFELIKQLGNGAFIAEISDTLDFGEGNTITLEGKLNVEKFEDLKPARLGVVEGEGIFEGVGGKATLTQAELDVLDVVNIDLLLT